jgi:hypothetical protein
MSDFVLYEEVHYKIHDMPDESDVAVPQRPSKLAEALIFLGGTWWHSWLRHCTTNWEVVGSIPNGVIGIFH